MSDPIVPPAVDEDQALDVETDSVKLTLFNRDEVIAFLDGPFVDAKEPNDPGSDVVVVDLIDRRAVVILGEIVTRTEDEFLIGREGRAEPRDRFPR